MTPLCHISKRGAICLSVDQEDFPHIAQNPELYHAAMQADMIEVRLLSSPEEMPSRSLEENLGEKKLLLRLYHADVSYLEKLSAQIYLNRDPYAIDIPYTATSRQAIECLRSRFPRSYIQVSYHDPDSMPSVYDTVAKLRSLIEEMAWLPCDAVKCAIYPSSLCMAMDMLLMLQEERERRQPERGLTLIAMGEKYSFFRPIAHFFGNTFTFTCLPGYEKAPGQIDIDTLLNCYRLGDIRSLTSLYALIGDPVGKSLSHTTHTKLLHMLGHTTSMYVKIEISYEELSHDLIERMKKIGIQGLSVTTPLKKKAGEFCCERKGPVNTMTLGKETHGLNTDVLALMDSIQARKELVCTDIGKRLLILGGGDVAESLIPALCCQGWSVGLWSRSYEKTVERFSTTSAIILQSHEVPLWISSACCIVNTARTEAMQQIAHRFSWGSISARALVAEFSYPHKSEWIEAVAPYLLHRDRQVISGLELWIRQAAHQFLVWGCTEHATATYYMIEQYIRNCLNEEGWLS